MTSLVEPAPVAVRWQHTLRRHFDRAADTYGAHAGVQHRCIDLALADWRASGAGPAGRVLDLGCGDGHLARQLAHWPAVGQLLAVDLSEAMLRGHAWSASAASPTAPQRLCADAGALPLASASLDVIVSHFALHWCLSPAQVLAELRRVIAPTGWMQLVIPVAGSLPGRSAGDDEETLRPAQVWHDAAIATGWRLAAASERDLVEHHADAQAWLAAVRAMGVTARRDAAPGLAGRARHRALLARLEALREPEGIPLRYRVWQACLRPVV